MFSYGFCYVFVRILLCFIALHGTSVIQWRHYMARHVVAAEGPLHGQAPEKSNLLVDWFQEYEFTYPTLQMAETCLKRKSQKRRFLDRAQLEVGPILPHFCNAWMTKDETPSEKHSIRNSFEIIPTAPRGPSLESTRPII